MTWDLNTKRQSDKVSARCTRSVDDDVSFELEKGLSCISSHIDHQVYSELQCPLPSELPKHALGPDRQYDKITE